LCGYPPFWGDTEKEIYARIRRGTFAFDGPDWERRSPYAKDLITKLLIMEPENRISIEEALRHPWIVHEGDVYDPMTKRFLSKIRRYSQFPLLKKVALAIMVQHLGADGHAYLKESYECFETNEASGDIDAPCLKAALRSRAAASTDPEVEALIKAMDLNRNGRVSYIEFAAAVMPRLYYLDGTKVYYLFDIMDIDNDGVITFQDLKKLMGEDLLAAQALEEADLDGDGKIEFSDFFSVMGADEAHIL
jgi:calcium-dependent protein kinase